MCRDLKPCVRCNGTGVIQVLDFSDPYCLLGEEWPMKDTKCHGCGVLGYRPVTHAAVLCTCVWRKLRRNGVNIDDQAAVVKALAPEPPATG